MQPVTRSLIPGDYHQCAPLKAITVNEAIGDLVRLIYLWIDVHDAHLWMTCKPPFDWYVAM